MEEIKENEVQKVLEELKGVRPEQLTGEAKRLFEAIMKHKQELSERYRGRHLFYDGCIYALEEILKPLKEE